MQSTQTTERLTQGQKNYILGTLSFGDSSFKKVLPQKTKIISNQAVDYSQVEFGNWVSGLSKPEASMLISALKLDNPEAFKDTFEYLGYE